MSPAVATDLPQQSFVFLGAFVYGGVDAHLYRRGPSCEGPGRALRFSVQSFGRHGPAFRLAFFKILLYFNTRLVRVIPPRLAIGLKERLQFFPHIPFLCVCGRWRVAVSAQTPVCSPTNRCFFLFFRSSRRCITVSE